MARLRLLRSPAPTTTRPFQLPELDIGVAKTACVGPFFVISSVKNPNFSAVAEGAVDDAVFTFFLLLITRVAAGPAGLIGSFWATKKPSSF